MKSAYIYDGVRSGIGSLNGSLSNLRADDLAAAVISGLLEKHPQLDKTFIEDVILGCANQSGEDNRNVARMAALLSGLPFSVPGITVNRLCASGLAAVTDAARAVSQNEGELFVAGGIEHMTRAPLVISKPSAAFGRDSKMYDTTFGWRFENPKMQKMYGTEAMGETAENLFELYSISRERQDAFAFASQQKAAQAAQRLAQEILPIAIPQRKGEAIIFDKDEFAKPQTTLEALAKLRPAFREGGSVTAGNASGLNDGAAALLVGSQEIGQRFGIKPLAKILSSAVAGVEPRIMGIGPVEASRKALKRAGLTLKDIDLIEINEAFAVQVLSVLQEMELSDQDSRVNPNGGAIALGHPLGMSGARLALTAALELSLTQKKYALVTMCVGVGQGFATVLERA
jgi:3-oxoadipyl-CoA thiolase